MIVVSVIIPVYNAALYLERCISSFLAQSMSDYELILVDDGSTDGSSEICDRYDIEHDNIHVIHQANQGVSAARQKGLDIAEGRYCIFADPDDWVEPTMLDELVHKVEETDADVTICDFIINASEQTEYYKQQKPRDLKSDAILRQLIEGELHGSTCNKLYSCALLRGHHISFPLGVNYCEDLWFNIKLFLNQSIKIAYINKAYYHYDCYSNSSGLSRKFSTKSVEDYWALTGFVFKELDENEYADEFAQLRFNAIKLAFRSDCPASLFYSIFPERFDEFKRILSACPLHWAMKNGLCLALNGHLKCGRLVLSLYENGYLPIAKRLKSKI